MLQVPELSMRYLCWKQAADEAMWAEQCGLRVSAYAVSTEVQLSDQSLVGENHQSCD